MSSLVNQKDDDNVHEEDWSEIMSSSVLSGGFARHDHEERISLMNAGGRAVQISSTASLSPLDMINLSLGLHDTTGHRIWMGARLFLHALPSLEAYFRHQHVLELGSGTGLSGIAVSKYFSTKNIVLTDASESVLDLCRFNVARNQDVECEDDNSSSCYIQVAELTWGETLAKSDLKFDTVLATDVLYDIQSWDPLLQTVVKSLRDEGIFLLSHVPRAALPEGEEISLEDYLILRAESYNLHRISTLRPSDLSDKFDVEMEETGASIFIFQKTKRDAGPA